MILSYRETTRRISCFLKVPLNACGAGDLTAVLLRSARFEALFLPSFGPFLLFAAMFLILFGFLDLLALTFTQLKTRGAATNCWKSYRSLSQHLRYSYW
jgi:hypothetical protein